jgi:predicted phage terminase large subunit-like protein
MACFAMTNPLDFRGEQSVTALAPTWAFWPYLGSCPAGFSPPRGFGGDATMCRHNREEFEMAKSKRAHRAKTVSGSKRRCTTWGTLYKKYYLLDVFRQRLNYPDLKRKVIEHAQHWDANTIPIEDKASGTQLIQDLKSECMFGVTSYEPPTGTDKVMRLHAQTAVIENGLVFFPRSASWLPDYVHELTSFPGTKHDDQIDSTTQFLDYIRSTHHLEVWMRLG